MHCARVASWWLVWEIKGEIGVFKAEEQQATAHVKSSKCGESRSDGCGPGGLVLGLWRPEMDLLREWGGLHENSWLFGI
jgi:hypothetical protein